MSSVFKLQIHKWSEGPKLSLFSLEIIQSIAIGAEAVHGVIEKLRSGEIDDRLPGRPDLDEWLKFYDDHRRVSVEVMRIFPEIMGRGQDGQDKLDAWRKEAVTIKNDPEKFKRKLKRAGRASLLHAIGTGFQMACFSYKKHLEEARLELKGKQKPDKRDLGKILKNRHEFHWYMRVGLPCVIVYRTFPITLLRKAIRGGKKRRPSPAQASAIERLVRLDPLMMHHPAIVKWWNEAHGAVRQARFKQLTAWAAEGLDTGKFSARQIKESLGGLILEMAATFGRYMTLQEPKLHDPELTAEQVRQLFYAVAQDKAGFAMGVVDEDLEDLERGSWRRAIHEHKKIWHRMFAAGGGFKSA